jgi:hypothetical protein
VILNARIGLKHVELDGMPSSPPASVVNAIGQLLHRTVRQTDCVAQTSGIEFTIATGSIHFDSARNFAERVCRAIVHANLGNDQDMVLVASCGVMSITEHANEMTAIDATLANMRDIAGRRAALGLQNGITGVIGAQEEILLNQGQNLPALLFDAPRASGQADLSIDLATLLKWIKEGREEDVLAHIGKLSTELQPLVDLLLKQQRT